MKAEDVKVGMRVRHISDSYGRDAVVKTEVFETGADHPAVVVEYLEGHCDAICPLVFLEPAPQPEYADLASPISEETMRELRGAVTFMAMPLPADESIRARTAISHESLLRKILQELEQ